MYGLNAVRVMLTSTSSAIDDQPPPDHLDGDRIDLGERGRASRRCQAWQSISISPSLPMANVSRGPISVLEPYSTISAGPRRRSRAERGAIIDPRRQEAILLQEEDRPHLELGALLPAGARLRQPLAISGRFMCRVASECSTTISTSAGHWCGRSAADTPGRTASRSARGIVLPVDRDLDRVMLALVAHLGLALDRDRAFAELAPQRRAALRLPARRRRAVTFARFSELSRTTMVCAVSSRGSASSMPSAEKLPGSGGTITRGIFSARASSMPCSGPPPP